MKLFSHFAIFMALFFNFTSVYADVAGQQIAARVCEGLFKDGSRPVEMFLDFKIIEEVGENGVWLAEGHHFPMYSWSKTEFDPGTGSYFGVCVKSQVDEVAQIINMTYSYLGYYPKDGYLYVFMPLDNDYLSAEGIKHW